MKVSQYNRTTSARIVKAFESQLTFPRDNISMTLDNLAVEVTRSAPATLDDSLGYASIPQNDNIDDTLVNNEQKLYIGDAQKIPVDMAEASISIPHEAFNSGMFTALQHRSDK